MTYNDIILDIGANVASITINRPHVMNAASGRLLSELDHALRFCDEIAEVRAIIVVGTGKAFCAGADVGGGAATWDIQKDMGFSSCPIIPAYKLKKLVIAALNGHALGLGFGLAMQCDFRVAALEGKYGLPEVQHGVLGDSNMHWLLPRLVGMEKALRLHLLGERLDGAQLADWGLATKAVPAVDVLCEARALAQRLIHTPSGQAEFSAKRAFWQSCDKTSIERQIQNGLSLHCALAGQNGVGGGTAVTECRARPQLAADLDKWSATAITEVHSGYPRAPLPQNIGW